MKKDEIIEILKLMKEVLKDSSNAPTNKNSQDNN